MKLSSCPLLVIIVTTLSSWLVQVTEAFFVAPQFVVLDPPPAPEKKKGNKISTKISNMWKSKNRPSSQQQRGTVKPTKVETIEQYKTEVADVDDQIVVVRFYSPWCKTCKAAEKYYHKLCRDNPNIKFVELPTTPNNKYLHEGLGVPSFPYGHIYHPDAGLVEELKINKKVFGDFERVLKYYIDGQGDVDYPEEGLCEPAGCRIEY